MQVVKIQQILTIPVALQRTQPSINQVIYQHT